MRYDRLYRIDPPWVHLVSLEGSDEQVKTDVAGGGGGVVGVCVVHGEAIQTSSELFDGLSKSLQFPDYFGRNWAALDECLMDMTWLPADAYVLVIRRADVMLRGNDEAFIDIIRLLNSTGAEWSSPAEDMARPDSSAKPFHTLLDAPMSGRNLLKQRLRRAPEVSIGEFWTDERDILRSGPALNNIGDLLRRNIVWRKDAGSPAWQAFVDGEQCRLVMNDFPAEPLFTLTWRGQRLDFDDAPMGWVIPRE